MSVKVMQESLVYDADLSTPLSHEKEMVLSRIGNGRDVLEVGAHTGYFSAALKRQGCRVTAVELDPRAAEQARSRADHVICGDMEDPAVLGQIRGPFDVVLFMHVLEHMSNPWTVLRHARTWLKPGGFVLVLIPNIACWRIRKDLFFRGSFEYTDIGHLDRTHLRFFTLSSGRDLLASSGYEVTEWAATDICVPLERRMSLIPGLKGLSRKWHDAMFRRYPNLCSEILMFRAVPSAAGAP